MTAIDEKQRETADSLLRVVLGSRGDQRAVWNLAGAVGSGKSLILRLVHEGLKEKGVASVLVTAPTGEVDAASIALAEMASQLKSASCLNGEMAALSDPTRQWNEKLTVITRAVEERAGNVVLLCDEPSRWFHHHESLLDDTPAYSARLFVEWMVQQAPCRRVIAGWVPHEMPVVSRVYAPRLEDGRSFLAEHAGWKEGEALASDLRRALSRPLPERCLWEMKLLVALSRIRSPKVVAALATEGGSVTALLTDLLDGLEAVAAHRPVCQALARLSLLRTPADRQVFDALTHGLSSLDRDLVAVCLCEADGDRLSLHPLVRHDIVTRAQDPERGRSGAPWMLPPDDRRAVHQRLTKVYERGTSSTVRDEWESLHHDLLGGDIDPAEGDVRLWFVEQLHEIGRTLSYVHGDFRRAARLFRLAIKLNPKHSYSHHYLAFNLDWLAEEPEEVEKHYQEAIRLQSTHPWWWSRWISYLATRGRFKLAKAEWRKAVDAMSVSEDGSPPWLFQSLHRWVARWLLHWGELDFAEHVLRSIPAHVVSADVKLQALFDLLTALRAAERGVAVFPLTVSAREWRSPTPHTDLPLTLGERSLRGWMPARVESVDRKAGLVFLRAAERPSDLHDPLKPIDIDLTRDQVRDAAHGFSWDDLQEGKFVELARYGDDGILRIGLHRETTWNDRRIPVLIPPPDRWFQSSVRNAQSTAVEPA